MPQNNPSPATTSKSESASFALLGANFVPATGVNFIFQQTIEIPVPFTSMEFIHDIVAADGGGQLQLYFQARLTPTTISHVSNAPIFFPDTVGGTNYPVLTKSGLGPAFNGVSIITPTGDITGQADNLDLFTAGNAADMQGNLILSVPIIFTYILASAAFPLQPLLQGTVTYTFYR